MLSPANGFYYTPGLQEVRLAYVINRTDPNTALTCLEHALLTYPGRTEPLPASATQVTNAVIV